MTLLKPNYVTDNDNKKVAVQLSIKTYQKIEDILENYGLYKLMEEDGDQENLKLENAKQFYAKLKKKK